MRVAAALVAVPAGRRLATCDKNPPCNLGGFCDSQIRNGIVFSRRRTGTTRTRNDHRRRAARSAGGPHDFFSEGDYWWPDPKNPDGPYIRRDGETNPDNFVDAPPGDVRLSLQVPALNGRVEAHRRTQYAAQARRHLRAWFVDDATR